MTQQPLSFASAPSPPRIRWHPGSVTEEERAACLGLRGGVVWLTGLSGSGKSTVARALEAALVRKGINAMVLDGDNMRFGLNKDAPRLRKEDRYTLSAARRFGLGFSEEDRAENIRRVGEVAKLLAHNNVMTVAAFVSPSRVVRERVRALFPPGRFLEVFCNASLKVCARRDPKGLYRAARAGRLKNMTGLSAPYEPPRKPDLVLQTGAEPPARSVKRVLALLEARGLLRP